MESTLSILPLYAEFELIETTNPACNRLFIGAFTQVPGCTVLIKDAGILYVNVLKLEIGKQTQANIG